MKITKEQLKQIIKEELEMVLLTDHLSKTYIDPVIKYKVRRIKRAKNHEDPNIRKLANGSREDLEMAIALMDALEGELEPEGDEQKDWDGEIK